MACIPPPLAPLRGSNGRSPNLEPDNFGWLFLLAIGVIVLSFVLFFDGKIDAMKLEINEKREQRLENFSSMLETDKPEAYISSNWAEWKILEERGYIISDVAVTDPSFGLRVETRIYKLPKEKKND